MKTVIGAAALALVVAALPAAAQNVKVTPLGSHAGKLCDRDRATIFEYGIHAEMKTVVNEYHKASLAVFNGGLSAGTNESVAQGLNELVRPASVLLTHPNEAVTEGGKLRPTTRAVALARMLKAPLHLAVSGRTMEFDAKGQCVKGC